MKFLLLAAALSLSPAAFAQTATAPAAPSASCKAQSDAKKLAGAAQKSFMTKCEKDAASACDVSAATQKLAGAAKTSFTKKCVRDRVGA